MLYNATGFKKIYLIAGKTDLRKGINGLAAYLKTEFNIEPFQEDEIYLFCGNAASKIKGLVWEPDGYLLLSKVVSKGHYIWPRTSQEAKELTQEQFNLLMQGFSIEGKIQKVQPKYIV